MLHLLCYIYYVTSIKIWLRWNRGYTIQHGLIKCFYYKYKIIIFKIKNSLVMYQMVSIPIFFGKLLIHRLLCTFVLIPVRQRLFNTGGEGEGCQEIWEGMDFFFNPWTDVEFFSDPEGVGLIFFFMPQWQTFLINVIKRLKSNWI